LVVGIGAIAIDHVFVAAQGQPFHYHMSRGGGSVWNVLGHLAWAGFSTMACGVHADDELGTEAIRELAHFGVEVSGLVCCAGRCTPVFTQWLDEESRHGPSIPQDNFTTDCPICRRTPSDDVVEFSDAFFVMSSLPQHLLVCTDRLTRETISAIRRAARSGSVTALDLGGASGLKGRDRGELCDWVGEFDVVALPSAVASWLSDATIEDFTARVLANRTSALAITDGRAGFRLFLREPGNGMMACVSPAPAVPHVVDASGAGDVFMARLVECTLQLAAREDGGRLSFPPDCLDAVAVVLRTAPIGILGGIGSRATLPSPAPTTSWGKRLATRRGQSLEVLREQLANTRPCCFCGRA
jgi:sugar/nucleoside kinase (ribokinase family)